MGGFHNKAAWTLPIGTMMRCVDPYNSHDGHSMELVAVEKTPVGSVPPYYNGRPRLVVQCKGGASPCGTKRGFTSSQIVPEGDAKVYLSNVDQDPALDDWSGLTVLTPEDYI